MEEFLKSAGRLKASGTRITIRTAMSLVTVWLLETTIDLVREGGGPGVT